MDIRVLRYFLAVAREESISGAAESLHLSQPTLSRQLSDLEEEIGKTLFIRGSRRITLTEHGTLLRKRAGEIIDLMEKTTKELIPMQSGSFYSSSSLGSLLILAGPDGRVKPPPTPLPRALRGTRFYRRW